MAKRAWSIITGASSGIGNLFVRELAKAGHPVLAVARRRDRLEQLAAELNAHGGRVEPCPADLASAEGVKAVVTRASALSDVELVVNNAGVSSWGRVLEIPLEKHLAMIRLNVEALTSITCQLLPMLVRRGSGGIINVASVVGFQPMPYWATYAATKAFVLSFTEALAHELRGSGVRALAICPGVVNTELYEASDSVELSRRLPSLPPQAVVAAALHAYESGRVVKVVGLLNLLLALSGRVTPRFLMRTIAGNLIKPKDLPRLPYASPRQE